MSHTGTYHAEAHITNIGTNHTQACIHTYADICMKAHPHITHTPSLSSSDCGDGRSSLISLYSLSSRLGRGGPSLV